MSYCKLGLSGYNGGGGGWVGGWVGETYPREVLGKKLLGNGGGGSGVGCLPHLKRADRRHAVLEVCRWEERR